MRNVCFAFSICNKNNLVVKDSNRMIRIRLLYIFVFYLQFFFPRWNWMCIIGKTFFVVCRLCSTQFFGSAWNKTSNCIPFHSSSSFRHSSGPGSGSASIQRCQRRKYLWFYIISQDSLQNLKNVKEFTISLFLAYCLYEWCLKIPILAKNVKRFWIVDNSHTR